MDSIPLSGKKKLHYAVGSTKHLFKNSATLQWIISVTEVTSRMLFQTEDIAEVTSRSVI